MCFLLQDALHVEWKMDSEFIMQIHSKKKRNKVKHLLITPCCSVLEAQPSHFFLTDSCSAFTFPSLEGFE